METKRTISEITVNLTNEYFRKKDGEMQGRYMKGMTQGTWEQIKKNAETEYQKQPTR